MNTIFCSGMMRSGSTWSYNAVRAVAYIAAEAVDIPFVSTYLDSDSIDPFLSEHAGAAGVAVIKSHSITPYVLELARQGAVRNVCTFRDPRDAVASRQKFKDESIGTSVAMVKASMGPLFHFGPETLLVDYRDIMDAPKDVLARISSYMNVAMPAAYYDAIVDELSQEKMAAVSAATDDIDKNFHLHRNHLNGGIVGRWKDELSETDMALVQRELAAEIGWFTNQSSHRGAVDETSKPHATLRIPGHPPVEPGHQRGGAGPVLGEAQHGRADRG